MLLFLALFGTIKDKCLRKTVIKTVMINNLRWKWYILIRCIWTLYRPNFKSFYWILIILEQFSRVMWFLSTKTIWRWWRYLQFLKKNDFRENHDCDRLRLGFWLKIWYNNLTLFSYAHSNFQVNTFFKKALSISRTRTFYETNEEKTHFVHLSILYCSNTEKPFCITCLLTYFQLR